MEVESVLGVLTEGVPADHIRTLLLERFRVPTPELRQSITTYLSTQLFSGRHTWKLQSGRPRNPMPAGTVGDVRTARLRDCPGDGVLVEISKPQTA